jgi:RHS repeat-associated protein
VERCTRTRRRRASRILALGGILQLALHAAAGSAGAQTKPPPGGTLPPNPPPSIAVTTTPEPSALGASGEWIYRTPAGPAPVDIHIRGCDNTAINASSLQITWNDTPVANPGTVSSPTPACTNEVVFAPVRLDVAGGGVLETRLCDALGVCHPGRRDYFVHETDGDRAPQVTAVLWRDWRAVTPLNPTGTEIIPPPYTLTVSGAEFWFGANFSDDNLATATSTVTLNGAPAANTSTLRLASGSNTIVARICDAGGRCAERTVQVTSDQAGPVVTLSPAAEYRSTLADQAISITWSDAASPLDTATRRVVFNGVDVTGTLTHESGHSYGSVRLNTGENVLLAHICDRRSGANPANCTDHEAKYYHVLGARVAPIVDLAPHPGQLLRPPPFEGSFSYSTVPHYTLDQPRSATLAYHSASAAPMGTVHLDVTEASGETPTALSIALLDESGARVLLTNGSDEAFFRAGPGLNRLTAQFKAFERATGAHAYTAVVRSWWSDGSALETRTPVVVLIRNDRASAFGAGWALAGYQRVHVQGQNVVVADGDGSLLYFTRTGCANEAWAGMTRQVCSFTSPEGESSVLQFITEAHHGPHYVRTYLDGSFTFFLATGTIWYHRSAQGVTLGYQHDGSGRLAQILPPLAGPQTFNYSAAGRLESIQDGYGRTTNVLVDARNHLTTIHDPDLVVGLKVAYDTATSRATHWTPREGEASVLSYNAWGDVSLARSPVLATRQGAVRLATANRPLSAMTLPAVGRGVDLGTAASRVHPSSLWLRVLPPIAADSATFRVDRHGLVTHLRDREGRVTTIFRDRNGLDTLTVGPTDSLATRWNGWRMVERIFHGDTTRYVYEPRFLQLARVVAPTGDDQLRVWYNDNRLADSVWADRVGTTRFSYDSRGRVVRSWDDHGEDIGTTYEGSGRDNTRSVTRNGFTVTHTRDAYGRVESSTNALGQTSTIRWNALNQPVALRGPAGDSVRTTYRAGALASLTDANNQTHQFLRNALGLETVRTDPRGQQSRLAYNPTAGVDSVVNRRGQVIRFEYDAQGRALAMRASDGSYVLSWYDDSTKTTVMQTAESTDTLHFGARGVVELERSVRGGGRTYRIDRTLRLSSIPVKRPGLPTLPFPVIETVNSITGSRLLAVRTSQTSSQGRLVRKRLTSDAYPFETVVGFGRDPLERLIRAGTPDPYGEIQPWVSLGYGDGGAVTSVSYPRVAGMHVRYHHDVGGRITGRVIGSDSSAFGYDQRNWLASHQTIRAGATVSSAAYTFDPGGNRTDRQAVIEPGNRLMAHDGWQMTYDADGNLTRRYKANVVDQAFTWNAFGQLTSVTTAGAGTVTFQYDGLGRRIRKTGPQGSIDYVYDGMELALEVDAATGEALASYVYLPGVDHPYAMHRDGREYRYITDSQGSVVGLASGDSVVSRYRYDPWGRTESTEGTVVNPFRFAGRELDAETGLYYVRARYYDPAVGRFISEDPSHLSGGLNLYAYAANNPVSFTDPSGLEPCKTITIWQREQYDALSAVDKRAVEADKCAWIEPGPENPILLDGISMADLAKANPLCANNFYAQFHADDCDEQYNRFGIDLDANAMDAMVQETAHPQAAPAEPVERTVTERAAHVLKEVVWGECTADAAGLVLGAIAGKLGKMAGQRAAMLRDHASDAYRVGLREVQDIPAFRVKGVQLLQRARMVDMIQTGIEFTQFGATVVGVYQLSSCVAEQW